MWIDDEHFRLFMQKDKNSLEAISYHKSSIHICFSGSREDSEISRFFVFLHIRMMGYFRLGYVRVDKCPAVARNRRKSTVKIRRNPPLRIRILPLIRLSLCAVSIFRKISWTDENNFYGSLISIEQGQNLGYFERVLTYLFKEWEKFQILTWKGNGNCSFPLDPRFPNILLIKIYFF